MWKFIASLQWGTLAEWANAIAVIVAATLAVDTVKRFNERRASERQSDLATSILESIYRYEMELNSTRATGEFLSAFEAAKPYRSDFEVSLKKLDAYERRLPPLRLSHEALFHLVPSIRAVFGDPIFNAIAVILNTLVRLDAAVSQIRQYNQHGKSMAELGHEFTGWNLDGIVLDQSRISYYWTILLDDADDTSQMKEQFSSGKDKVEERLLPIIRSKFKS